MHELKHRLINDLAGLIDLVESDKRRHLEEVAKAY